MEINIGKRKVGDNRPCFLIAEIGSNHNQDFNLAIELIDAAAEAKVDAVKFQTFKSSEHYSKNTPEFFEESEDVLSNMLDVPDVLMCMTPLKVCYSARSAHGFDFWEF